MDRFIPSSLSLLLFAAIQFLAGAAPFPAAAQDEDLHYQAVAVKGHATIYHDSNDETVRLHKGQSVYDGDSITTDNKAKVVLRLKSRAYVFIASNTKVHLTRLGWSDTKRLQSRMNLIKGRVLTQIAPGPPASFEVSMGKLLCRAHGTVFDVTRKKEDVKITAFEGGSVVASSQGTVEMAKPRQIMKYENGRFRYKHYLKLEDEGRLEDWKATLAGIQQKPSR